MQRAQRGEKCCDGEITNCFKFDCVCSVYDPFFSQCSHALETLITMSAELHALSTGLSADIHYPLACYEGCECEPGYMRGGKYCVKPQECG